MLIVVTKEELELIAETLYSSARMKDFEHQKASAEERRNLADRLLAQDISKLKADDPEKYA